MIGAALWLHGRRSCACLGTFTDPYAQHSKSGCVDNEWHGWTPAQAQGNHLILPGMPAVKTDCREDLLAAWNECERKAAEEKSIPRTVWRFWRRIVEFGR